MITKLNVATIYVLDKNEALDFYVDKLGLEKGNDVRQGTYRWLTVRVRFTFSGVHSSSSSLPIFLISCGSMRFPPAAKVA